MVLGAMVYGNVARKVQLMSGQENFFPERAIKAEKTDK